jgi:hypothetical protein
MRCVRAQKCLGAKGGLELGSGSVSWPTDEKVGWVEVIHRPLGGIAAWLAVYRPF